MTLRACRVNTRHQVHIVAGYTPVGAKVRAWCTCGYATTPRVDRRRAVAALQAGHGCAAPVCGLCGRDRGTTLPPDDRYHHLQLLTDDQVGDQMLVCRDDERTCMDRSAQRQVHLDRVVLGDAMPRPTLRAVR